MSEPKLVLVTGASGFIGAHVVVQLLEAGYRVRATARGSAVDQLRSTFADNSFEVVSINDIASGDFTTALQGVNAIIHLASPLAGREPPEVGLNTAIEGTLNVLRQAVSAGVLKVVLTSSWATTLNPDLSATFGGRVFTEKDWGQTTKDELLSPDMNALSVYCGTKILSERAAWKYCKENPELDLATINPPFVYGPPVNGLASGSNVQKLGSNGLLYQLIYGEAGRPLPMQLPPFYCHVKDVARAHVLALNVPKLAFGRDAEQKRFLVAGPGAILNVEAVRILQEERPALKDRLPSLDNVHPLPGPLSTIDTTRAKEILGLKGYIGARETLLETIDALVAVETTWQ